MCRKHNTINKIQHTSAKEINDLHSAIEQHLRTSLAKALKIGSLLSDAKAELPHGSYTNWINDTVSFSVRTARRYVKLHDNRKQLTETDSIGEAYKLLKPKTDTVSDSEPENIDDLEAELTLFRWRLYFCEVSHIISMLKTAGLDSIVPNIGEEIRILSMLPKNKRTTHKCEMLSFQTTEKGLIYRFMPTGAYSPDGYTNINNPIEISDDKKKMVVIVYDLIARLNCDFHFKYADSASKKTRNATVERYTFDNEYLVKHDESKQLNFEIAKLENKIDKIERAIA
jgi:hypothetical protein